MTRGPSIDKLPPIGMTSMTFWNCTVEEALPQIAEMGYDAVEIWAEHLWRDDLNPSSVACSLETHGLRRTVHCPIMDLNITSPNAGIRKESVRQNIQAITLAHDLGAELVIVHPGALFSKHDSLDKYWEWQLDAFERFVAEALRLGVRLVVENMDVQSKKEVVKTAQDIRRITDHFAPGELGFILDTTHLGTLELNLSLMAQFDEIAHVHVSDAEVMPSGQVRTHLPLGEGKLDFKRLLEALLPRLTGILQFETFIPPGNPDKVLAQKEYLEKTLLELERDTNSNSR